MILFIAAAIVVIVLLLSRYTYKICFHVAKNHFEDPYQKVDNPQFRAVQYLMDKSTGIMERTECEDVYIQSHDDLTLHGRFYDVDKDAPVIIVFHGYRSPTLRDCAGGFSLGLKLGYNVLAVDQRAHGTSGGRVISFGIKERYDCLKWIDYVRRRLGDDTPIILCGISMGAATILMSASLQLPKNVRGIMADCPYSSPSAIIRKVCKDVGYPPTLAYPFLWLGALIYGGFRLDSCDAVSAVKNTDIPILLIHGGDDRFVPCEMSRQIYENCADHARLHIFPDAGHGLSYIIDHQRYEEICLKFLKDVI
ncbi:MAG: alpha/beta hydrolase [Oscillospiraceae bacterium]|nr:alpha/beta hydrolase [Oscillospiraceae bacterium]